MELSLRLRTILSMIDRCKICADIGTDHAYVPVQLLKKEVCSRAIASDINKGPLEKARNNIIINGLEDKIECRLGEGFNTIKPNEIDCAVIAGMGGNLIRDIIEEGLSVFKTLKFAILQPVQNPEVLRRYIYDCGYKIIDEELCIDENKFYEIIKVSYDNRPKKLDSIYYEVSEVLINKKHPFIKEYINSKINKYFKIYSYIEEETSQAKIRKIQVKEKIYKLKELLKCV